MLSGMLSRSPKSVSAEEVIAHLCEEASLDLLITAVISACLSSNRIEKIALSMEGDPICARS